MECPIETEFKVWITNGDDYGQVTVTTPAGRYPTKEDVEWAVEQAQETIKNQKLKGWKVCDRRAFMKGVLLERSGQRMAVLGVPAEWDAPYSPRKEKSP